MESRTISVELQRVRLEPQSLGQSETEEEKKIESRRYILRAGKKHASWLRKVTEGRHSYSILSKITFLFEEDATKHGGDHGLDQCEDEEAAL